MRIRAQFISPDRSLDCCESSIYEAVRDVPEVEHVRIGNAVMTKRDGQHHITIEFTITPKRESVTEEAVADAIGQTIPRDGRDTTRMEPLSA